MRRVLFIFGQLSDDDVEWIVDAGEKVEVPAGESLIHEGVHVPNIYFLVEGKMAVEVAGVGRVAVLGRGEVIGEMSFVDANPPGATVKALEPCLLLGVNKESISARMNAASGFAGRFYKALAIFLSNRLRDTTRQLRGAGPEEEPDNDRIEGQLDDSVLKTVHLASYSFDRLAKKVRNET